MSNDALPTLTGAFGWWIDELKGLAAPAAARRRAPSDPAGLVLDLAGTTMRLAALPRDLASDPDAAARTGEETSAALLAGYLRTLAGSRALPPVTLRVKAPGFLRREVMLPAAAARNFANLLALDLKRATPFRREDVYAGYETAESGVSAAGLVPVTQYVVKRAAIDAIVRDLAEEGLAVVRVECLDETRGVAHAVAVTRADDGDATAAAPLRRVLLPIALIGALALSAIAIFYVRSDAVLAEARSAREAVQIEAAAARAARQGTETEAQTLRTLATLQSHLKSRALILETLTRLMPDSAYVSELRIDGADVEITGLAASASALLPLLENSDLFVDARMSMPQMLDAVSKKERFGIKMRLRGAAAETAAPPAGGDGP